MNNLDFLFIHLAKCGGTTIRNVLYYKLLNKYKDYEIFLPEKKNIEVNFFSNEIEEIKKMYDLDNLKVVLSHCLYNDIKNKYRL